MANGENTRTRAGGRARDPDESSVSSQVLELLDAIGGVAASPQDKAKLLSETRHRSPQISQQLDTVIFDRLDGLRQGLASAKDSQEELRALVNRLVAPPLYPAVYLGPTELTAAEDSEEETIAGAVVQHGSSRRHVPLG